MQFNDVTFIYVNDVKFVHVNDVKFIQHTQYGHFLCTCSYIIPTNIQSMKLDVFIDLLVYKAGSIRIVKDILINI